MAYNGQNLLVSNAALIVNEKDILMRVNDIINETLYPINTATEAEQLAAVQRSGNAIQRIENPSEAVKLAAVQQTATALLYIKNPSEAVQWAAVLRDGQAIEWVKNPSSALLSDSTIKHSIIKAMLTQMKKNSPMNMFTVSRIIKHLRYHDIDWPELSVIERSFDKQQGTV